jgi:hypothetical protein
MPDTDSGLIVIHACLALMRELEDSLRSSQTALLSLDAAETQRCTREQERLRQMLRALLANPTSAAISALQESRRESPPGASELARCLRVAAVRVQQLARVQLALLRRSQQSLNVLANWMADPQTPYGLPPTAGRGLCA